MLRLLFLGFFFLGLCKRIEVAGTVWIFEQNDRWARDGDFLHMDVSAEDVEEAVAGVEFGDGQKRLSALGLHFQVAHDNLFERADGGLAYGHLSVEGFADVRENHAFEEGGTGADEIGEPEEQDQDDKSPRQSAEPAAPFFGRRRNNGCIGHKNPRLSTIGRLRALAVRARSLRL